MQHGLDYSHKQTGQTEKKCNWMFLSRQRGSETRKSLHFLHLAAWNLTWISAPPVKINNICQYLVEQLRFSTPMLNPYSCPRGGYGYAGAYLYTIKVLRYENQSVLPSKMLFFRHWKEWSSDMWPAEPSSPLSRKITHIQQAEMLGFDEFVAARRW